MKFLLTLIKSELQETIKANSVNQKKVGLVRKKYDKNWKQNSFPCQLKILIQVCFALLKFTTFTCKRTNFLNI